VVRLLSQMRACRSLAEERRSVLLLKGDEMSVCSFYRIMLLSCSSDRSSMARDSVWEAGWCREGF
jgi:hypothetical protein